MNKYRMINVGAYALLLIFNFLLPASKNIAVVNNHYSYLFHPASYAFSIWGLIYLCLLWWVIRPFIFKGLDEKLYRTVTPFFVMNVLLNGLWILFFSREDILVSLLTMVALLGNLIVIYSIISNNHTRTAYFRVPFSLYMGWISVATIVNVFITFDYVGIDQLLGITEYGWTIILLLIGGLLGALNLIKNHDYVYPLVLIWAYIAICVEQYKEKGIVLVAVVVIIFLSTLLFRYWLKKRSE